MTTQTRPRALPAAALASLLSLSLLVSGRAAHAQSAPPRDTTIDPQLFQPAIGPQNFLTIEGAQVPDHKRLSFGLSLNYQQRPFTVYTQGGMTGETHVIDNQFTGELDAAIGLFNRFQLGIGVPVTLYLDGDEVNDMGAPSGVHYTERGIGDIRVEGKAHLATLGDDDQYDLALSAGVTIPAGHATSNLDYLGDKTVTGRIKAIGTADFGPVTLGANLGILIRGTSHSFATELGPQLLYGAAANFAINPRTGIILEGFGRSGLNEFIQFYNDVNPFEIDLAGRRSLAGMWSLTGGVGRGLGNGIGAPDLRVFLMASFNPDFRDRDHDGVFDVADKCPDQPEDRDGFQDADGCPDPDNDADGIPDNVDKCPNEAEDFDDFQDADGCPDPDNDKDGIPDLNDACPNAPEDHKGKRPNDGCPSTSEDSDGDGIPDAVDKCPDEPEDKDGFEDADGCPDPDNDKDGIPDAVDKCPLQPETLNAIKDDDGCPDPGPEIVRLGDGRIEVDAKIGFTSHGNKLSVSEKSTGAVNDVALVMKGHPEIGKLRIEVKADGVPKSETQRRADALREFLIGKGVEGDRLEAAGMGAGGSRIDFIVAATIVPPGAGAAPGAKPAAPATATPPGAPAPSHP